MTITPEGARNLLAEAHKRMTPAEIAANALDLAAIAVAQTATIGNALRLLESVQRHIDGTEDFAGQVIVAVRNAETLHAAHRKNEAREAIRKVAQAQVARLDRGGIVEMIAALRGASAMPMANLFPKGAPHVD